MKRDKYADELEKVISKAVTLWDIKRMRDAMIETRARLESKYMELKRAEFANR